ncbi:MAG TPA: heat-inducible transcriptional repressor HrcA [Bacteroidota bacterium]|nr:heat-inducible transcriptional repressor HrcA [Bacteroidota bacterium]
MTESLNERERTILRSIIYSFIQTATPVGSRYISKRHGLDLSPATVRNVMSDLEFLGYIDHPHTSAGRIPTDKGYRFYVDSLIELETLSEQDRTAIQSQIHGSADPDEVLKETSKILGTISHQLGIVSTPRVSAGVFDKLELVSVSASKVMVIISIRSGLVKTIMMEVHSEIPKIKLEEVSRILNERLSGLTLRQIRRTFRDRVRDMQNEETGLIRLFVESVDKVFDEARNKDKVHIGGTQSLLSQPEFNSADNFRGIIELLDNEDIIVHILEKKEFGEGNISVSIGSENQEEKMRELSVVTSQYAAGDVSGTVGIIGAKRMDYSKMIPLVDYMAKLISMALRP